MTSSCDLLGAVHPGHHMATRGSLQWYVLKHCWYADVVASSLTLLRYLGAKPPSYGVSDILEAGLRARSRNIRVVSHHRCDVVGLGWCLVMETASSPDRTRLWSPYCDEGKWVEFKKLVYKLVEIRCLV